MHHSSSGTEPFGSFGGRVMVDEANNCQNLFWYLLFAHLHDAIHTTAFLFAVVAIR